MIQVNPNKRVSLHDFLASSSYFSGTETTLNTSLLDQGLQLQITFLGKMLKVHFIVLEEMYFGEEKNLH